MWLELHDPRLARAKRLAVRDAEYAAHAAPVKLVQQGDTIIETRGNRVCASSVGIRHQYVTDKGVTYLA